MRIFEIPIIFFSNLRMPIIIYVCRWRQKIETYIPQIDDTALPQTTMSLDYISCTCKLYDEVADLIRKTCPDECIISIEKIINPVLEERYAEYKQKIEAKNGCPCTEKIVFHGTSENAVWSIIRDGFSVGSNIRSAYGIGTYFAETAAFSRAYARENSMGDNVMLISRVALGKVCQGISGKHIADNADYGVDYLTKPNMYVMPDNSSSLPIYLVRFYAKATDIENRIRHVGKKK